MVKRSIFGLFALILLGACTIVEISDGGGKTPLGAISKKIFHAPMVLKSSFPSTREKSYYAVQISKKGFYSLSVSPSRGWNLRLSLLDNAMKPVAIADDSYQNQGETIPLVSLEEKLYYVLVEHRQDFSTTSYNNRSSSYSLLLQHFVGGMPAPFQLAQNVIPSLENVQTLTLDLPLYGFLIPHNSHFLSSPSLENLTNHIARLMGMPLRPYHLDLYIIPEVEKQTCISASLSVPKKSHASLVMFDITTLPILFQKNSTLQLENFPSLLVSKNHSSEKRKQIIESYCLMPQRQYMVALLGSYLAESSSFLETQRNPYQILIKTSET